MTARTHTQGAGALARAFTLLEMIVVMIIIVLIMSIAVPAFSNMVYSQEEVAAEAQLESALGAARDAATRNGPGDDTAAVFTFQPGGRMTIITAVRVGVIRNPGPIRAGHPDQYEVFAPIAGAQRVQLGANWMVRAYAPRNTLGYDWYPTSVPGARYRADEPAWVFPETGFFDHSSANDGRTRNTFMVRFAGGTGALSGMSMPPCLVVLPRPSASARSGAAIDLWRRPDRAEDLVAWATRVLTEPISRTFTVQDRYDLIGRESGDMVLAMPVQTIALYDESRLARALGTRQDRFSNTIIAVNPQELEDGWAIRAAGYTADLLAGAYATNVANAITRWIEGYQDLASTNDPARADTTGARLYTISRYLGTLQSLSIPRDEEVNP